MVYSEKDLSSKKFEQANIHPEFLKRREKETKLVASAPEIFERNFKSEAFSIEQTYLSTPNDDFSLRVRKTQAPKGEHYTATLKDRGLVVDGVRDRLEINVPISAAAYEYYRMMPQFPDVRKLRTHPWGSESIAIDFFQDIPLQVVEVEHNDPVERNRLTQMLQELSSETLVDQTGNPELDNEAIAHHLAGVEKLTLPESLDDFADRVSTEMLAQYVTGKNQVVVGLTGMSGSGKTTVTEAIKEKLTKAFGEKYTPLIISTDDYHFGKTGLEQRYGAPWTDWDDPRTYNTQELARDLALMAEGHSLIRRHFDFTTEEPIFDQEVAPSPFIVIEGLYAGSKDLESVRDLHFELPTGIATSIGRDVRRLVIENRANRVFPTPESRLKYQLETALPLYLGQERPRRNSFSASSRVLAERAFMLNQFRNH